MWLFLVLFLASVRSQCLNNGIRHDTSKGHICECSINWKGQNCDVWIGNLEIAQRIKCEFITIPTHGKIDFPIVPQQVNGAACKVLIGQSTHLTAIIADAHASAQTNGDTFHVDNNFFLVPGNEHPVLRNYLDQTVAKAYSSFKMSDIPMAADGPEEMEVVTFIYREDRITAEVERFDFSVFFDVDECATGLHDCHYHAKCTNTHYGWSCQCDLDFFVDLSSVEIDGVQRGQGTICVDKDHAASFAACNDELAEIATAQQATTDFVSDMIADLTAEDIAIEQLIDDAAEQLNEADTTNLQNLISTVVELTANDVAQDVIIWDDMNVRIPELQGLIANETTDHANDKAATEALLQEMKTNITAEATAYSERVTEEYAAIDLAQTQLEANQTAQFDADMTGLNGQSGGFTVVKEAQELAYQEALDALNAERIRSLAEIEQMRLEIQDVIQPKIANECGALKTLISNWKNTVAGFTHRLGADYACCSDIQFGDKIFNSGDEDWDGAIFTAPVSGYYYFSYHIYTNDPAQILVKLLAGEDRIGGDMATSDSSRNGLDFVSMSTVAHVTKGEEVRLSLESKNVLLGSLFTGFLVYADPEVSGGTSEDNYNQAPLDDGLSVAAAASCPA